MCDKEPKLCCFFLRKPRIFKSVYYQVLAQNPHGELNWIFFEDKYLQKGRSDHVGIKYTDAHPKENQVHAVLLGSL